ncbi:MAG: presenilin family intramembrane aspartyl protease [Candidatus Nanoarchaeia archaeon]
MGLVIISQYIDIEKTSDTGRTHTKEKAFNSTGFQPPQIEPEQEDFTWIYIAIAILIGTILVLLIIKLRTHRIWLFWFLLSIGICLYIALSQFVVYILKLVGIDPNTSIWLVSAIGLPFSLSAIITIGLVALLTYLKVYKKNILVHNITEIFIYGGLAALIVPIISITAAIVLLIMISLYDAIAVWKTKHMVTLANYQTENKLFAGLMMPYDKKTNKIPLFAKEKNITKKTSKKTNKKTKSSAQNVKTAILGGGDIAFPLIFAGAVMKSYGSFLFPIIIIFTTAIALFLLLTYSKKDRFYPAMPFISAGAFLGFAIVWLIHFF